MRLAVLGWAVVMGTVSFSQPLGVVVNHDGRSITFFDVGLRHVFDQVALPADTFPIDVTICRAPGHPSIVAVTDLGGYVHLIQFETRRYLSRVPVNLQAVDASCCGGFLVVSGGSDLRNPAELPVRGESPPAVIDLVQRKEIVQGDPTLPTSVAVECTASGGSVVVVGRTDGVVRLLELNQDGQLSDRGSYQPAQGPSNVFLGSGGGCAVVVEDDSSTAAGLTLPGLGATPAATLSPPSLALLGGCATSKRALVHVKERVHAFTQSAVDCALDPATNLSFSVGGPSLDQFVGADSLACSSSLLVVAEDGGDLSPSEDAVGIYDPSTGERIGEIQHPSLHGPLGIALAPPPFLEVPALGLRPKLILALLLVFGALVVLRGAR